MNEENVLSLQELCELAGVSRSGYYAWENAAETRRKEEEQDQQDFAWIKDAYLFKGIHKGAKAIKMTLRREYSMVMNLKKVKRLMKKYNLVCPLRQANPYRKMAKAQEPSEHAGNLVNRNFRRMARGVLLSDITYVYCGPDRFCVYLSTIKDAYTNEILSYEVSMSLEVDFVIRTVEKLYEVHGETLKNVITLFHTDQGSHYISKSFKEIIEDHGLIQSMSRRGNCWDNAPQESFFGHMKDEIKSALPLCRNFEQVKALIHYYMDYYNHHRCQWGLCHLTPAEYYEYSLTGELPEMKLYEQAMSFAKKED